ncbi:MAG: hypothetical protein AAF628_04765 [Planctomycetota bacterium]
MTTVPLALSLALAVPQGALPQGSLPQGPVPVAPAPASAPALSEASIVTGVLRSGVMSLEALGLGAGGFGRRDARPATEYRTPGEAWTPGGARVRAQREGVKIDFPSGVELLLSPDGLVHLRDGAHTTRRHSVLELWLADGSRVRAVTAAGPRPLQTVELQVEERFGVRLWDRTRSVHTRARMAPRRAELLVALGRGDVLYGFACAGPMVALERELCPVARVADLPPRRLVVLGDLLVESLQRLPGHVPPASVQMPQAPEAAQTLAALATRLFPAGRVVERPAGAVGDLVVPLIAGFRLQVEERVGGVFWLGLHRGDSGLPAVEWRAGPSPTLHLVRPFGGRQGVPRHFLRGLRLVADAATLLGAPRSATVGPRLTRVLRGLGAAPPSRQVPVNATTRRVR